MNPEVLEQLSRTHNENSRTNDGADNIKAAPIIVSSENQTTSIKSEITQHAGRGIQSLTTENSEALNKSLNVTGKKKLNKHLNNTK
jgi:hypothetical protein